MDLLKKMESVQQRADQVDLKAERRNKELTGQLQNLEATIVVIQELNTRLVGTLSKFSGRFNHIISSIDRIETHLEEKIDNINTCIEHNGKGDSTGYLDRLLSQNQRYHAIATDDAHFATARPDHGRNWVVVRGRHLEPGSLLEALHAGRFYSSQGPQILE